MGPADVSGVARITNRPSLLFQKQNLRQKQKLPYGPGNVWVFFLLLYHRMGEVQPVPRVRLSTTPELKIAKTRHQVAAPPRSTVTVGDRWRPLPSFVQQLGRQAAAPPRNRPPRHSGASPQPQEYNIRQQGHSQEFPKHGVREIMKTQLSMIKIMPGRQGS